MGTAIANELVRAGAEVTLVLGPAQVTGLYPAVKVIPVTTAEDMLKKCCALFPEADGAILCAAVADFRPAKASPEKIKKNGMSLTLVLEPTPDIAANLGKMKRDNQFLAGFAMETENELHNAFRKLKEKNFDFIVLNSLKDEGAGFRHDTNKITIIDKDNKITNFELKPKTEVAHDIAVHLEKILTC
jgi:phosphopantothenoylcysteine decarboxylase / phosphopantothenate---cysteine ligase